MQANDQKHSIWQDGARVGDIKQNGQWQSCTAYLGLVSEPLGGAVESGQGCRTAAEWPAPASSEWKRDASLPLFVPSV